MSTERWLPVVGYEGLYEVSDFGRLKSLNYRGNTKKVVVLKPQIRDDPPYHKYTISKNGVVKTVLVHWLVMAAFEGPANGRQIDHKKGYSNALINLRYCTGRQNLTYPNVRFKKPKSSKYPGVSYNGNSNGKKKWRVTVGHNKKKHSVGTFATEEEARDAYLLKVKQLEND